MDKNNRKSENYVFSSLVLKKWLTVSLVLLCVSVSWVGVVDQKTESYVDSAIIQALTAYASARALNAGISLLQSAEISVGIGVDGSIQPFQVLDPVDDMVEDYATTMKYAIASLMIQKLLVEILSTSIFKLLLTCMGALLLISLLFDGLYLAPVFKSFLFISLVRFLFVATVLLSGLVDSSFVNEKTVFEMGTVENATKIIENVESNKMDIEPSEKDAISEQIRELEERHTEIVDKLENQREVVRSEYENLIKQKDVLNKQKAEKGIVDRLNIFKKDEEYSKTKQETDDAVDNYKLQLDIQEDLEGDLENVLASLEDQKSLLQGKNSLFERAKSKILTVIDLANITRIKQVLSDSIESMIRLIALFFFKTMVMPLIFLLLLLRAFKMVWGIDPYSLARKHFAERTGNKETTIPAEKG